MADPDTLVDRLLGYTYDWNGSEMADEAPALTEVSCGLLREAALRIREIEAAQGTLTRQRQDRNGLGPKDSGPVGKADALNELQRLGQDFDADTPEGPLP